MKTLGNCYNMFTQVCQSTEGYTNVLRTANHIYPIANALSGGKLIVLDGLMSLIGQYTTTTGALSALSGVIYISEGKLIEDCRAGGSKLVKAIVQTSFFVGALSSAPQVLHSYGLMRSTSNTIGNFSALKPLVKFVGDVQLGTACAVVGLSSLALGSALSAWLEASHSLRFRGDIFNRDSKTCDLLSALKRSHEFQRSASIESSLASAAFFSAALGGMALRLKPNSLASLSIQGLGVIAAVLGVRSVYAAQQYRKEQHEMLRFLRGSLVEATNENSPFIETLKALRLLQTAPDSLDKGFKAVGPFAKLAWATNRTTLASATWIAEKAKQMSLLNNVPVLLQSINKLLPNSENSVWKAYDKEFFHGTRSQQGTWIARTLMAAATVGSKSCELVILMQKTGVIGLHFAHNAFNQIGLGSVAAFVASTSTGNQLWQTGLTPIKDKCVIIASVLSSVDKLLSAEDPFAKEVILTHVGNALKIGLTTAHTVLSQVAFATLGLAAAATASYKAYLKSAQEDRLLANLMEIICLKVD